MPRLITAPTDLSGCVLWFDAQDIASITKDGSNRVSQWSDKSTSAAHAVQAVDANKPIYSATGFGGYPCLDWGNGAAAGRVLTTPSVSYGVFTIFIAGTSGPGTAYLYTHNSTAGSDREYLNNDPNPNYAVRRGGGAQNSRRVVSGVLLDANRHIFTRVFNGFDAGNLFRYDGHADGTLLIGAADPGVAASAGAIYLGNHDGATLPLRGVMSEFIIFNRVLSEGEIVLVEQYMSRRWAVAPRRMIVSPLELTDCGMWFDASQGVTSDVNGVSQWNDSSGNARHLAQSTNALKPAYNASNAAYGGKPTIDWNTAGNSASLDRSANDNLTQPLTVFACANFSNTLTTNIALYDNVSGSEFTFERLASTGNLEFYSGNPATPFPNPLGTKPFVLTGVASSVDTVVRLNGVQQYRAAAGATGITTLRLGTFVNGFTTANWNGSIAEFLVYRRRLSDTEIAMVEAYLKQKYAL